MEQTETDGFRFCGSHSGYADGYVYADGYLYTPTGCYADGDTPTAAVGLGLRRRQTCLPRRLLAVGVSWVSRSERGDANGPRSVFLSAATHSWPKFGSPMRRPRTLAERSCVLPVSALAPRVIDPNG